MRYLLDDDDYGILYGNQLLLSPEPQPAICGE